MVTNQHHIFLGSNKSAHRFAPLLQSARAHHLAPRLLRQTTKSVKGKSVYLIFFFFQELVANSLTIVSVVLFKCAKIMAVKASHVCFVLFATASRVRNSRCSNTRLHCCGNAR